MPDPRIPEPILRSNLPQDLEDGTTIRGMSPLAGPLGMYGPDGAHLLFSSQSEQVLISPVLQETIQLTSNMATPMAWDAYWRLAYQRVDLVLQSQADELLRRGNITYREYQELVLARNRLAVEFRKPLSPFGRQYSEILKPASQMPTPEGLLARKGSIRAVLESVGKSRASVNWLSMGFRLAGPVLLVLDITVTTVSVARASEAERGRVAAREYTGLAAGTAGFSAGAWAGCVALAALGSPSLLIPVVGEVTEGALCAVGGVLGGLGLAWAGREAGKVVGEAAYDFVTTFRWE